MLSTGSRRYRCFEKRPPKKRAPESQKPISISSKRLSIERRLLSLAERVLWENIPFGVPRTSPRVDFFHKVRPKLSARQKARDIQSPCKFLLCLKATGCTKFDGTNSWKAARFLAIVRGGRGRKFSFACFQEHTYRVNICTKSAIQSADSRFSATSAECGKKLGCEEYTQRRALVDRRRHFGLRESDTVVRENGRLGKRFPQKEN